MKPLGWGALSLGGKGGGPPRSSDVGNSARTWRLTCDFFRIERGECGFIRRNAPTLSNQPRDQPRWRDIKGGIGSMAASPVSYTHPTLPTNSEVYTSGVSVILTKTMIRRERGVKAVESRKIREDLQEKYKEIMQKPYKKNAEKVYKGKNRFNPL